MTETLYFTPERRAANMKLVIDKLSELDNLDFNSTVFAFADIIHSSFLQGLHIGKSKEDRQQTEETILDLNHKVVDVLNGNGTNMMHDMIVLSNLIMDAIEKATQNALEAK